jgi:hypothetical protein
MKWLGLIQNLLFLTAKFNKHEAVPYLKWLVHGFQPRWLEFDPSTCGIFGGQSVTGAGFLLILRFLLSIIIPPTVPYSLIIISSTIYIVLILRESLNIELKAI